MNTTQKKPTPVSIVTAKILCEVDAIRNTGGGKALLANLRASIGRELGRTSAVWPLLFEHLPDFYLSRNGEPTKEELAILYALQNYALYQQGCEASVLIKEEKQFRPNFGESLADLRTEKEREAMDRRFRILITANNFFQFEHRTRQMMQILKARTKSSTPVDFSNLAGDFYWFLRGHQEDVRFRWAEAYYRRKKEEKGEENA
ncbi:type I-E CRISPR-associated protein Cse2/CasB [Murdochiella massiliensis]|uniref:type I-E CRISPR-associated protein Cse2/CasB n=1 Tax=Murdochiella massiliensis TaxID=1673723 RepID=UPI0008337C0F|nr:type I-E CRISPR-associated protein Cse2/CasB [Murdochiella massiliensis]